MNDAKKQIIRDQVRKGYAQIATTASSCCGTTGSSCCGSVAPDNLAQQIGYSTEDLASLPDGANMG
ncbi:MAG TPA: arsenite S-adenosylmethyltransferase, partial [Verrucomicrobiota bacterium]|nr:arsenite S-adenosylmethyltransferase [Verrucomicrobiota bacterium]